MRMIGPRDCKHIVWRNGMGSTTECLVEPSNASLETLDYRVFWAEVTGDEPFSRIENVDRTLFILEGAGFEVMVPGERPVRVTPDSEPFVFTADRESDAKLIDGPVIDLNIITRRSRYQHSASRLNQSFEGKLVVTGSPSLIFCWNGTVTIEGEAGRQTLHSREMMVLEQETSLSITTGPTTAAFQMSLHPVAAGQH